MSAEVRYLRGDMKEIELPVHGTTVIEKGDFVVINAFASCVTQSGAKTTAADFYAFPFSDVAVVSPPYFINNFVGVAMKGSVSGVTENIPIATAGVFRYPLRATTGVTATLLVSATTTADGPNLADQTVLCATLLPQGGVTWWTIGRCVKTEAAATYVDFTLITRLSGVSYFDNVVTV